MSKKFTKEDILYAFKAGVASTSEGFNGECLVDALTSGEWGSGGLHDSRSEVMEQVVGNEAVERLALQFLEHLESSKRDE